MNDQATNVLLIEDNPGDADLVRLRLVEGKTPVNVFCVNRLADGIASLSAETPSLILLDLNLPDSHGSETFRKILEKAPDVPIVILSGQEDEALAIRAVHQGVQDYLVKGEITSRHLERAMRYAVERQGLLRSLEISRKQQLEFKNRFLSHVSHELRTPLTCIHQYVSLLYDGLSGAVSPEQRDHLRTILKSVNQLHAMIRDLLEATRAEAGKIRIEQRCVALGDLLQQAVVMMQAAAQQKHVGLEIAFDQRLPMAFADPDRVLEVLLNLIDNAIKFTPPDGAVVVKACLADADPAFVYISVADTGSGISPEALPLIFERLYQDPDQIDGNRNGLGLGLYIAQELVSLHGGRIWVTSQPGEGSTFSFTLPLYSLAKLLLPVITQRERLRDSFVLVRVALTPLTQPPRGNWRGICQQVLQLLPRCVYVDKDLVLPPMGSSGSEENLFVVASTDMERVNIMLDRIRGQLDSFTELKTAGGVRVTAEPLRLSPAAETVSLEQQVQQVADCVTDRIMHDLGCKQNFRTEENHKTADGG
ncbi:MAG: hybrid sensor histidine kinase/response regulator [Terriglobales bacterium]